MKKVLRQLLQVPPRQAVAYHRYPLNFLRNKPNFIVIGTQKAATTSLHSILNGHPQITSSIVKETHFYNMNYARGTQYYHSLFPINLKNQLSFESTPDYFDHPKVPQLIRHANPNIKLVLTLREPVARAFSHFNFVQSYNESESLISFEDALKLEKERISDALQKMDKDPYNSARELSNFGYVRKGEYAYHLKRWLKCFPIKQFFFMEFNEITSRNTESFDRLYDFLGITKLEMHEKVQKNTTKYANKMKLETMQYLKNHYFSRNIELFDLINKTYNW